MSFFKSLFGSTGGGKDRALPEFKYYPAAKSTGIFQKSPLKCMVCGQERDYAYIGPVYAEEDLEDSICPWCIFDGSAQKKFSAMLNPVADTNELSSAQNRLGDWQAVPAQIIEQVAYRTPGVQSWQEANWFFHCQDAAVYLGAVGVKELNRYGEQATEAIRQEAGKHLDSETAINDWMTKLSADGSPRAYLFQCPKCNVYGGFSDCD